MIDPRPTPDAPDDDPYVWLEEIEGERACAWADMRSAATLAKLGDARFEADSAVLLVILDRPDRIPLITRRGGLIYNFWRDGEHPRGVWRRTTLEAYRQEPVEWDVLLDLDALAEREAEDWVWQGADTLPPRHDRAMLRLSRGGSDAAVLREFDLTTREFVAGGFVLPEAKGGASWLDADTLLLSSAFGAGHATQAGYARTVRLWARETNPADAATLFEVPPEHMSCWGGFDRENDQLIFSDQTDFFNRILWIGDRSGPVTQIDLPTDAWMSWHRNAVAIKPRSAWTIGGVTYPGDTILGIARDAFLAGKRDFRVLFTPGRRQSLQGYFWSGADLIISVLDDLRPVFLRVRPDEGWHSEAVEGLPPIGTVNLWSLDADTDESNGDLLAMTQTPVLPPALMLLSVGMPAPALLRQSPASFDPGNAVVTRHEAVAPDGERIPYVQVGSPGETGDAPVHLGGYGGFRVSRLPVYASTTGKLWLEHGGTTVVANIRGGGEFGTWWHDAGRREGKALSHDDFAAVATDLVRRG